LASRRTSPDGGTVAVRLFALALVLHFAFSWGQALRHSAENPAVLDRDWLAFHRAGSLLWDGRLADIYIESFQTGYPFVYPPYVLYACAPLGLLPGRFAYAALAVSAFGALGLALWVLRRGVPGRAEDHTTAALVVLASAPWNGSIIVGQWSPWLLLIMAGGLAAWRGGRPLTAGVVLSFLAAKPNLGLAIALVVLAKGGPRMAIGWGLGVGALLLSVFPLGNDVWESYLAASMHMGELVETSGMPMWKHQTLYAFWWTVLGSEAPTRLVHTLWVVSVLPLVAGVLLIWRGPVSRARLSRLFGALVLFVVGCNPYVYFYDGLLLAIPALIWHVERGRYHSRQCHRLVGSCILAVFAWQHLSLFALKGCWAWVGPLVWLWLLAELYDLTAAARAVRSVELPAVGPLAMESGRAC
jgi:hypothetical protein